MLEAAISGGVEAGAGIGVLRTTLLDALYGGTRNGPVDGLGGIFDCLDGALARDGRGAEEAGLAGDLLTEHGVCVCVGGLLGVVEVSCVFQLVMRCVWCTFRTRRKRILKGGEKVQLRAVWWFEG
jgi:hypothetical protein